MQSVLLLHATLLPRALMRCGDSPITDSAPNRQQETSVGPTTPRTTRTGTRNIPNMACRMESFMKIVVIVVGDVHPCTMASSLGVLVGNYELTRQHGK